MLSCFKWSHRLVFAAVHKKSSSALNNKLKFIYNDYTVFYTIFLEVPGGHIIDEKEIKKMNLKKR